MFKYKNTENANLPVYGFKIHVSATIENYKELYSLISPILDKKKIPYKYIHKDEDVFYNFSNQASPASSGKYFTIYPENKEEFHDILDILYKLIPRNMEGIYILSDRPYKDSNNIFYRYGFLKEDLSHIKDGVPTLIGPNGEEWQDYQKPYFDLPSWIEDIQEETLVEESYLAKHYSVNNVLAQNNGGNVYDISSLINGNRYVMKESKPHILAFEKYKKSQLRENEFVLSQKLDKYIPQPYEVVSEWINKYYIYEYVHGENLSDATKPYVIVNYKEQKRKDNYIKLNQFISIVKEVLQLVKYFHDRDVVLNDIHSENFIKSSDGLFFVDLENSYKYGDQPNVGLYSIISLKEWNVIDGKRADCHKIGNLILFLLGRLQINSMEEVHQSCQILDMLLHKYGLRTNLTDFIQRLFSETIDIEQAIHLAEQLYTEEITKQLTLNSPANSSLRLEIDVANMIPKNKVKFQDFLKYKYQSNVLKNLIEKQENFGLDGLSGILILMHEYQFDKNIIQYGIEFIISKLVMTDSGRMIPLGVGNASPYLANGTAGFIRALLRIDRERYRNLIDELAYGLVHEFAQYADFWNGMLGIADTLIEVNRLLNNNKYQKVIYSLLKTAAIYARYGKIETVEFIYVFNKYGEKEREEVAC